MGEASPLQGSPIRAMVIDDDPDDRALVARALRRELDDVDITEVADEPSLRRTLEAGGLDLVITDYHIGWTDGLRVVDAVKSACPDCAVVMYTGTGSEEVAVEGMKRGLDDYIVKSPLHMVRLAVSARAAALRVRQRRALDEATSARAQALAEVRALTAERSAVLRQIADGVIIADADGRITFVNPVAERLHGTAALDIGVESYSDSYGLLTPEGEPYPPERLPLARAALHGETVRDAEWRIRRPDGREVVVQGSASPMAATNGARLGAVLILRDVTEQRYLLEAEREARRTAEVANRAKSEFLAVMSHELRTPLNAILGYADLLEAGVGTPLTEQQRKQVERIAGSGRHLLSLIEEVLSFARIDAGHEQLRPERVSPLGLTHEVAELMEPLIQRRGVALRTEAPEAMEAIETDSGKLRQILLNLLSNALKFTSQGEIVLTVQRTAGTIEWAVRDTGIGIPPEHLAAIFQPFWQVDQGTTRRVGGTGLGLSVSTRLAELLGGSLQVQSTPGVGSVFTLRLPAS